MADCLRKFCGATFSACLMLPLLAGWLAAETRDKQTKDSAKGSEPLKTSDLAKLGDPLKTAAKLDGILAKEWFGSADGKPTPPAPLADDQTFLRRASLDLTGELPSGVELARFVLDPSPTKRRLAVERLLDHKQYGQNWARYWRDVIFTRRSDDRALLAANACVTYLTEQFNKNTHWDQIAQDFITATGDVREEGSTAIIMAQMADPSDTTAEMSRILLGIQIQCAQCHNHPTDRWKREQFHELAAFFPRIGIRQDMKGPKRSFEVVSLNQPRGRRSPGATEPMTVEHYMPDLEHPAEKGTLMKPVFFATGQKLDLGVNDKLRREKLAQWITAPGDRWFAKAFVNRIWAELVGRGFYEPVDDIGPDRKCSAPQTLDYLAEQFAANQYDVKWLFRTIMATAAYSRRSHTRGGEEDARFASNCPQRLRSDQLYNSLTYVLGVDEGAIGKGGGAQRFAYGGPRFGMSLVFGYDPSERRDEIAGTIPQALVLMNQPDMNRAINGRTAATALGKILAENKSDEDAVVELYIRCLAREPKPAELTTCLSHVKTTAARAEAFEDLMWALINSTEFLHRK